MHSDIRMVHAVWKWVRSILTLAAIGGAALTWASALTNGLPLYAATLFGLWALLLASCSAWVLLNVGDRVVANFERVRDGRRVANLVRDWQGVGNAAISIENLVRLWLERAPDNKTVRAITENTMLRTLKAAIRQGFILPTDAELREVNVNTLCDIESAADFFAKAKWIYVKKESQIVEGAPTATTVARPPRRNWVLDYRDPWR